VFDGTVLWRRDRREEEDEGVWEEGGGRQHVIRNVVEKQESEIRYVEQVKCCKQVE
jgi:hypothetical protein